MPAKLEGLHGMRPEMLAALAELKERAEGCIAQAQAIEEASQQEGRALTEEESEQIETLTAQAIELTDEFDLKKAEEERAAVRATIELGAERINRISQPGSRTPSNAARTVQRMRNMFYDDPKRGFDTAGSFYAAVYSAGIPGNSPDDRIGKITMEAAASGMSQGVGADGGILVPPEFRTQIWLEMQQSIGNLLAMTDQFTVTGESLTMPASAETSRTNGSRYGGVQGFWIAEAAQITGSKPKVRQMKLEPQELAVLVYVTDKLLRNSAALEGYVTRAASEEILFLVNDAIVNGNGVGQPLGLLNSGGLVTVAKESGQAAATIVIENIHNMWARMFAPARAGAIWIINQDIEPQLEALVTTGGTFGFPVYLPQGAAGPTITESPNARLKGRPVLPVEYCQTLGTKGDITLFNPNFYATGVKGAMRDDMSMHLRFDFAETAFRFMFEIDGQTWSNTPLTPAKGTNTLSPYVTLATRA